ANRAFYFIRLGKLLELIEVHSNKVGEVYALDAGCGLGYFADNLSLCGYKVTGIDSSPTAIDFCKSTKRGEYILTALSQFTSPVLFDVVYSVDVLFHIVDDVEWSKSFTNLVTLVNSSGILIIS